MTYMKRLGQKTLATLVGLAITTALLIPPYSHAEPYNGPRIKLENTLSNLGNYTIDEVNKDIQGLDNKLFESLAFENDSAFGIWDRKGGFLEYHPELTEGNKDYEKYIGRIVSEAALEQFANSELGKKLFRVAQFSTIELEKRGDDDGNGISSLRDNVEREEELRKRKRTATTFSAKRLLGIPFGKKSEVNLAYNLIDIDDDERISYFGKAELDIRHGKLFGIPILPIDRGEIEFTPSTKELTVSYQKLISSEWPLAFVFRWENDGELNGKDNGFEKNSWSASFSLHSKKDRGLWQFDIGTSENQLIFAQLSGIWPFNL